jgi:hypothetical protein
MADQKISQLNSLTGANTASGDLLTIVDINDTTMGASGTNKKITLTEFQASPVSAGTANGVVFLNGSKVETSGSALTFDGTNFATTGTASAAKLIPTGGTATGNGMYLPSANTLGFSTNGVLNMSLDASGNLGLGVTPAAWLTTSGTKAFQFAASGALFGLDVSSSDRRVGLLNNGFFNASGFYIYSNTGAATFYQQISGQHQWHNAPSGTAGNTITFTQAMTLDASGNLGIGTASPAWRVHAVSPTDGRIQVEGSSGYGMIFVQGSSGSSAQLQLNSNGGSGRRYAIISTSTGVLGFNDETAAITRMTLDASGNLGVGTASPGVRLDVNGAARILAGNAIFFQNAAADNNATISCTGGSGNNTMSFNSGTMTLDASGNLGLNTTAFGTSAAGVLSLGTGTAPTTGPADTVQLFSVDRSAGNTIPAVRCEGSGVTNAGITNTTVTTKIAMQVNGTIYFLLATTNAT